MSRVLLVVGLLLYGAAPVMAQTELTKAIADLTSGPDYQGARWGILVVESKTGRVVYSRSAEELFAPASTTKLFTCAAALVHFGPDHTFETPLYQRGMVEKGVLHGDLILVATGDTILGGRRMADGKLAFKDQDHTYAGFFNDAALVEPDPLQGLRQLARMVKERGITRVAGEVLLDDRFFGPAPSSGSGPRVVTPFQINDSLIDVLITPGQKEGDLATSTLVPKTTYAQVDVQVRTIGEKGKGQLTTRRIGPERFEVRGEIPAGSKPKVVILAVDDPGAFARALFIEALKAEGIQVQASPLALPRAELPGAGGYKNLELIGSLKSAPLKELLKVVLKVSHNLYASTLPLLLVDKGLATVEAGMNREGEVLSKLGVDVREISLESGAGGGDGDRVSPKVMVQLLQKMRERPDFPVYRELLPILGVDGTLATVVEKDSPAAGKVFAKTGTYVDNDLLNARRHLRSKALAGYLTTAKGTELTFALFVNDVHLAKNVETTREGKQLGKICEALYQFGP
jgi:D-alanyl-D-alanine carboxypeptidase/D-alanyl-D-alanine-endopeptidase (penicillin-binding protein 4)